MRMSITTNEATKIIGLLSFLKKRLETMPESYFVKDRTAQCDQYIAKLNRAKITSHASIMANKCKSLGH